MTIIPFADLKDRQLYRLNGRNLSLGVWDTKTSMFYGLRLKFDSVFIDGETYSTARPFQEIPETLWEDILLAAYKPGSNCTVCHGPVEYIREPCIKQNADGTTREAPGYWRHLGTTEEHGGKYFSYATGNTELSRWLREKEAEYLPEDERKPLVIEKNW